MGNLHYIKLILVKSIVIVIKWRKIYILKILAGK